MPDVIFEKRENGVALITLNRPDSLNAMGGDLMPLLAQHLDECRWDSNMRCVVLTGAGRAFCAGGDVKDMAARGHVFDVASGAESATGTGQDNASHIAVPAALVQVLGEERHEVAAHGV